MNSLRFLRTLILTKVFARAVLPTIRFKLPNPIHRQFGKELRYIHSIGRKYPHFDRKRLPLENSVVIGLNPKALEQFARRETENSIILVRE